LCKTKGFEKLMTTPAPIALQLYTLREALAEDLAGVLQKVAATGYVGVEPYGGLNHQDAARIIKELGLEVHSAHAPIPLGETQAAALAMAEAYGFKRIIVPSIRPDGFASADAIKNSCDLLNQASAIAQQNGLTLGYHNHWWEYETVDGRPAYQIMLEHLDPSVFLQVDTYWVQVAGLDPAAVVRELGARAPLLHIKDGPAVKGEPMVALGDGTIDIPGIIKAGSGLTEWLVVELDECATDMMTAVVRSYEYLTGEGLARGR
jgi:sugar phosphate isomerase/epimerase